MIDNKESKRYRVDHLIESSCRRLARRAKRRIYNTKSMDELLAKICRIEEDVK